MRIKRIRQHCCPNIDCESGIIFDNDEDKTDSAALLPCIEQAREDVRTLRHLQLLHQNR
ncbi:DUF957 domain-containing protein [Escherichia coli]|nr:DUF957 domain-containing protein [Escherichia coli]RLX15276.1 DUF957 domain-containing protein [Escherichia coli]